MVVHLGGGVLMGIGVGYAIRKATRVALLILGLGTLTLFGMSQVGYVTVHWESLAEGVELGAQGAARFARLAIEDLSALAVGFGGGVFLGLRMKS